MNAILESPLFLPLLLTALLVLGFPLVVGYLVYVERKVLADFQARLGPMRVGPHGLLQAIADAVKLLLKEDIVPAQADGAIFRLAPLVSTFTGLSSLAVLPFSAKLFVVDVNVGLLLIASFGSLNVLGMTLGGWASNSHYSLLGSLRGAAQMVSYEVALTLALLVPVMGAGSLSMTAIVQAQQDQGVWFAFGNFGAMFLAFFVFFMASTAEANRIPFDLPEAEGELVGGFHTEYSGFRWALFMLGEYANTFVVCAVAVVLFFGGWLRPFPSAAWLEIPLDRGIPLAVLAGGGLATLRLVRRVPGRVQRLSLAGVGAALIAIAILFQLPPVHEWLIGPFWFFLKLGVFLYVLFWFRATFPRFRYDQLMDIGWRRLIPLALLTLAVNAVLGMLL